MHLAHKVKDIGRRQLAANARKPAPLCAFGIAKTHAILPFPAKEDRRVAVGACGHDHSLFWFCLFSLSMQVALCYSPWVAMLQGAVVQVVQASLRLFGERPPCCAASWQRPRPWTCSVSVCPPRPWRVLCPQQRRLRRCHAARLSTTLNALALQLLPEPLQRQGRGGLARRFRADLSNALNRAHGRR